ncbi:hypothetical protein GCM10011506_15170 [Marivirga lumbricoides]|uniref:DUF4374 domain-containing protein n=2 Tax=Marivirga lumbricoides TaxID=1046115 RepID=A0ABQ1LWD4_9BACT|nr:hypothetical protein GCM10011506_15170 [Marivirga lumbricoides]
MYKFIRHIVLLLLIICLSDCSDDNLDPQSSEYYKIFYGEADLEAVDFSSKSEGSGYIILANSKLGTDSDLYLISTDENGYEENTTLISIPEFYDKGVTLKILDNQIYILGTRRLSAESNNYESFLFKISNQLLSENDIISAENISTLLLTNASSYAMKMNDFIFLENDSQIIFGGIVEQDGRINEIVQIYTESQLSTSNENTNKINPIKQFPNNFTFDTTSILKVFTEEEGGIFSTVGQNFAANDSSSSIPHTMNIRRKVFKNTVSPSGNPIKIYAARDVNLGAALKEKGTSTYFYAGNYLSNDSLFIIRDILNSSDNPGSIKNSQSIHQFFIDEGHKVVSMAQKSNKDIVIATTNSNSTTINGLSSLLKFSAAGVEIDNEYIEFQSSNLYNVKKIMVDNEDKIVILSSLLFENDAKAIGLTKIEF